MIGHEYFHTEPKYHIVKKQPALTNPVTSVSHNNNINKNGWQAHYVCLSAPVAALDSLLNFDLLLPLILANMFLSGPWVWSKSWNG